MCIFRPQATAQLITADNLSRALQEGRQEPERLLRQTNLQPILEQLARIQIGLERSELDDPARTAPILHRPASVLRNYIPGRPVVAIDD
jgi:hypothetical protein